MHLGRQRCAARLYNLSAAIQVYHHHFHAWPTGVGRESLALLHTSGVLTHRRYLACPCCREGDARYLGWNPAQGFDPLTAAQILVAADSDAAARAHGGLRQLLYLDGHIEQLPMAAPLPAGIAANED
jgi:hypothetical protein